MSHSSTTHLPATGPNRVFWMQGLLLAALFIALYTGVVRSLITDWMVDPGESYGLLIPPLSVYIAWMTRKRILAEPAESDRRGLVLVGVACAAYLMGVLGAEFFLARSSLVFMLTGIIWTFWGVRRTRQVLLPVLLLLTALPLPDLIYNRISVPLQFLSSNVAAQIVQMFGISVYLDGNILYLNRITLGVVEACNGLRSLSSLLVLALIIGFVQFRKPWSRLVLLLLAPPVSIAVNILRVAVTALMADTNPALAFGFYHGFSGWLVFVLGLAIFWGVAHLLQRVME